MRNGKRLVIKANNRSTILYKAWKGYMIASIIYVIISSLCWGITLAQEKDEWPCFHGTMRTNKSAETGLLKKWPENGPELLWTISGLGKGYTTLSIVE